MNRQELISSKEYWSTTIALRLWTYNGSRDDDFDTYEKMAESIVDDDFIKAMEEYRSQLTDSKELPGDETVKRIANNFFQYSPFLNKEDESYAEQLYCNERNLRLQDQINSYVASKDARIRELEEENHRMNLLNKQYSAFRKEVMLINSEKLEEIDAKYFPF